MKARLALLVLLPLLPLLAVPTAPPSAGAAPAARACANGAPQKVLRERLGDAPRGIDLTRLGLWHKRTDRCVWTTVAGRIEPDVAQVVQVLYDTNPRRPGAEYYAFAYSGRDGDDRRGSHLVGLRNGEWRYLACLVYFFFRPGKDQVGIGLPKSCLGNPGRVRVKVQLWDIKGYLPNNQWRGVADQVPNRRWSPRF